MKTRSERKFAFFTVSKKVVVLFTSKVFGYETS